MGLLLGFFSVSEQGAAALVLVAYGALSTLGLWRRGGAGRVPATK